VQLVHVTADRLHDLRQGAEIFGCDVDHHVLAGRRTGLRLVHFDADAGHAFGALAHVLQDLLAGAGTFLDRFHLDGDAADHVHGRALAAAAGGGIEVFDAVEAFDAVFNAHQQVALFRRRNTAARRDIDLCHVGIGGDEELWCL
jgi:hypothetical protein